MNNNKLNREFFSRPTLDVAKDLLGKELVFNNYSGIITETEAYVSVDDPACHAAKGRTKRTDVMFGKPGFSYVYFIYGMYYCLNFVTEEEGSAAAVLIRGLWLDNMKGKHLDGPGKLCRELGITKEHNRIDIVKSDDFFVRDVGKTLPFNATPRIGIKVGTDKLWRFVMMQQKDLPKSVS